MENIVQLFSDLWTTLAELLTFESAKLLEPEMVLRLMLQCLLLVASAFFSSSETALFSSPGWNCVSCAAAATPRPMPCMRYSTNPFA